MSIWQRITLWWAARRAPPIEVLRVPPGATLVVTLSPEMPDVDLARVKDELRGFFGDDRKIVVARAGDVKFSVLDFEEPPE